MGFFGLKSWRPGELAFFLMSSAMQVLTVYDGRRNTMPLATAALVLMALQIAVEGPRWQFYLMYSGTVATASVSYLVGSGMRLMAGFLSLSCCILTVVINVLFPWFELPKPTGPYKVGRITRELRDPSRGPWVRNATDGGQRRLMVDFWYPAADHSQGQRSRYIDREVARSLCESFIGPRFRFLASHIPMVRTAGICDAPAREGRFPVLLFSHGLAASRVQNTALLEELASHGFICVACDHTFDCAIVRFPDGELCHFDSQTASKLPYGELRAFRCKQVEFRAADLSFLLDTLKAWDAEAGNPLAGRVDWQRAAAIGHSQGGATAAAAAQKDKRFQAAVLLDAWMWPLAGTYVDKGIPCPALLWESSEFLGDTDLFLCFNGELSSRLAAASPAAWKCVCPRAGHMEYADMALASPRFLRAVGIIRFGPSEMGRFQAFQSRMVVDFLRAHLRCEGAASSGRVGGEWSPPEELEADGWGSVLHGDWLKAHAERSEWTPKQRSAVKDILLSKVKRGEFEPGSDNEEHAKKRQVVCALVHLLVHHRSPQSIRELVKEVEAEVGAMPVARKKPRRTTRADR